MHATGTGMLRSCPTAVELYKNVAERGRWGELMMEAHSDYRLVYSMHVTTLLLIVLNAQSIVNGIESFISKTSKVQSEWGCLVPITKEAKQLINGCWLVPPSKCRQNKLLNLSNVQPRSEPALELYNRAASSVFVMYRSSGPNTGSNSGGGWILKKNLFWFCSFEIVLIFRKGRHDEALMKYLLLAELGYEVAQSNAAFILDRKEAGLYDSDEMWKRALVYWSVISLEP